MTQSANFKPKQAKSYQAVVAERSRASTIMKLIGVCSRSGVRIPVIQKIYFQNAEIRHKNGSIVCNLIGDQFYATSIFGKNCANLTS